MHTPHHLLARNGVLKIDTHRLLLIAPFNPKPLRPLLLSVCRSANKHKPWIETEYQGIVMENDNTVLLNPPLFALDKDAPLHYAGNTINKQSNVG